MQAGGPSPFWPRSVSSRLAARVEFVSEPAAEGRFAAIGRAKDDEALPGRGGQFIDQPAPIGLDIDLAVHFKPSPRRWGDVHLRTKGRIIASWLGSASPITVASSSTASSAARRKRLI